MQNTFIEEALKKQKWIKTGLVYLPAYLTNQIIPKPVKPSSRGFAIYIPFSEIFGKKLSKQKIISTIKEFRVSDAVASTSRLGVILENHGRFNKKIQAGLVVHLFPKKLGEKINQILIPADDRFIFFEQQLLNVIKLSLLYGSLYKKRTFQNRDVFEKYLTNVILGITDHLEKDYRDRAKKAKNNRAKKVEAMIEMALRNLYFNSSDQFRYLIGRYYQLFFSIAKRSNLRKSSNYIDITNVFEKATSFDLEIYYSLGFAVLTQFVQADIRKGKLKPNKFFINKNVYFRDIKMSKKRAVEFLNKLSITPKEFRKEFPKELKKTSSLYYSFILMRQKPMIKVNRYIYFPTSLKFLKEKITAGIYWEIVDFLKGARKDKFFRFFGEIFEEYVKDLFKRIYPQKSFLVKRCFFEQKYGKKAVKRTSDVMLVYGNEAIFIEANASRLRMVETAVAGDIDAFRKDLDKVIFASAKQLNRVIKDFRNNEFNLNGLNFTQITRIYPIILTISPVPQFDLLWLEEIEKKLKLLGYLQCRNIASLQIIDIEEMEMIEALMQNGFSFLDILKNKINDKKYIYKPMKNYLLEEIFKKNKRDYRNEYLHRKFGRIGKLIRRNLFNA